MSLCLSTPSAANTLQSQSRFSEFSTERRADLQGNLVLLAHYGGMVDGQFGVGTYSALVEWQNSVRAHPTGVLNQQQMDLLEQMASRVISELGMTIVEDLGDHAANRTAYSAARPSERNLVSKLHVGGRSGAEHAGTRFCQAQVRQLKAVRSVSDRCLIILFCAEGLERKEVVERLGVYELTVSKWLRHFVRDRIQELPDDGRPAAWRGFKS